MPYSKIREYNLDFFAKTTIHTVISRHLPLSKIDRSASIVASINNKQANKQCLDVKVDITVGITMHEEAVVVATPDVAGTYCNVC